MPIAEIYIRKMNSFIFYKVGCIFEGLYPDENMFFLQMLKGSLTPARWSCLEKRSMHHWKPTANRDTQSSREGKDPQLWRAQHSLAFVFNCVDFRYQGSSFLCQVCEASPPTASTAIHRLEVLGASLLLQVDWWHTYWHFPHGNAWSSPSVVLDRKTRTVVRFR